MAESLTEFIANEVHDPVLQGKLLEQLRWRGMDREHGLIFEDSVEEIDTPTRRPRVGLRVQLRHDRRKSDRFEVTALRGNDATLQPLIYDRRARQWVVDEKAAPIHSHVDLLLTVTAHTDKVFPGLVSTGGVGTSNGSLSHVAINGDNLHTLRALSYTHHGAVDLIYIDPPYNTGNKDWIYNDKRVDANDGYRHSKWLAFMHRRLELARDLLKDTGVVIVAIGDDEHHRLRMLMDDVFGEQNFIANLVWQGGFKNNAQFTGGGVDYMLVYARNRAAISTVWREAKPGAAEVIESAARSLREAQGDPVTATELHRRWIRANRAVLPGVVGLYSTVDPHGRAVRPNGDLSAPGGGGGRYTVINPKTGEPCKIPSGGWRWTEARMAEAIREGRVAFPDDDSTSPQGNNYLDEKSEMVAIPTFTKERFESTRHLERVLGDKRFPFPKDHEVLMRWFGMVAPKDAVILDFFGGSGSTLEAVLRLNEKDSGTRQCIIVTSNELGEKDDKELTRRGLAPGDFEWEARGVFEHVLRPRIETIIDGKRPDGAAYAGSLTKAHRVEFFNLDYMSDEGDVDAFIDYQMLAPLLWARAGAVGLIPDQPAPGEAVVGGRFAVLFDTGQLDSLVQALVGRSEVRVVFIVTSSAEAYRQAASDISSRLSHLVESVHLEKAYLQARAWVPRDRRRQRVA